MKLKEINRNGNITWSPKLLDNSYLAVGTATQQLDSNFNSKAQLEIFQYIPNEKGFDMPVVASVTSESKFSKLLWDNVFDNYGLIVGGFETGAIVIYDCKRLLEENISGEAISQILIKREHKGPVHAMDFNKFKVNLLATGGSESDIFIWDLNKFDDPMTPGNKSQPYEDIRSLSWNHKVQHILGSTSTHRCQIWDLRKSDPVIKLSDTQMKMKCNKLVWHPEISTRLCISSEDDHTPIIQLWDLRYIQCPFHTLQRHTKGIVDLEWCIDDPDILMSVGRDRQMICWNMSSQNSSNTNSPSEVIYEWELDQELINEAYFIPKHPGLVSISSFDCHISLYSIMGGRGHVSRELSDTVIDSFPLELYEEDNEIERMKREAEKAAELQLVPTPCLSKAPKWLKRPCGATFSFGGKLIQFCKSESSRSRNNSVSQNGPLSSNENMYKIFISQVSTQKKLVEASMVLDNAIHGTDSLLDYCQNKIDSINSQIYETENQKLKSECKFDLDIWKFIECHFFEDSRSAFLQTLGYSYQNNKNLDESKTIENLNNKQHDVASDESVYFKNEQTHLSINNLRLLPSSEGLEKSLAIALMTGDIDSAIDICLHENRSGEAAILAVSSGRQDLFEKVQNKIFENSNNESTTHLISIAVKRNWQELVNQSDLNHWKEALAWLLTYVSTEELSELCEVLGKRLEDRGKVENNSSFYLKACICYICSGSINNFVRCWLKYNSFKSTKDLQRLIEIIVLLCKSVGDDDFTLINKGSAEIFTRYALILISHGNLSTALKYLGGNDENKIVVLRHRICESLRNKLPPGIKAPIFPFKTTPILNSVPTQKLKVPLNAPTSSFTDSMKLRNEMIGNFSNCPNYQEKPPHFLNNVMQFPSQMVPNDMQLNYLPNQLNNNPMVTPPSFSNNISQNHFPSQTINHLPFLPKNTINFSQGNPLTPISTSYGFQNPHSQTTKSAWNDPPLLSENYRHETTKEETKIQPNFFNPTTSVTDISDLANLGLKMNTLTNLPNTFNSFSFGGDTTSDHLVSKNLELPNSQTFEYKSHEKSDNLSPEYEHTQKVLINLIEKCRLKDKSRQTKVKMDDIEKKITNLFDLIKTQPMSPELTNGFKTLISTLETNNYRQSLDEVNNIIQTVNFSEAGLYLPSVKMLIQCSIKILE